VDGLKSSGTAETTSNSFDFVQGALSMKWTQASAGQIQLTLCHKNPGWFAIGFGSTMAGSDILMVTRLNGVPVLREMSATGNVEPTVKSTQSITITDVSSSEGCTTAVSFSISESRFSSSGTNMIYAYSASSYTLAYHGPNARGAVVFRMATSTSGVTAPGPSFIFKLFHGISMLLVYVVLYPLGVFLARYYHGLNNWVDYHQLMMSIGLTQSLFTVLAMIVANNRGSFIPSVHRILGVLIALINLGAFVLGNSVKLRDSGWYITYRRLLHKIFGYFTCLAGLVNCYFGLVEVGYVFAQYLYLALLVVLGLLFVLASRYSKAFTSFSPVPTTGAEQKQVPAFTWSEVLDRVGKGSKWVVIDGHVYDVEHFMNDHPGGSMILERVLGTDCTDQFGPIVKLKKLEKVLGQEIGEDANVSNRLGKKWNSILSQYSLHRENSHASSNHKAMHKHSRLAHYKLSSLLIGRLKNNTVPKHDVTLSLVSIEEEEVNSAMSSLDFTSVRLVRKELLVSDQAQHKVYKFTLAFQKRGQTIQFKPGDR
jgi:hypothetical protein